MKVRTHWLFLGWSIFWVIGSQASWGLIWDPELDTLGITLETASPAPGQRYWELIDAQAYDPTAGGGRINIFYKAKNLSGLFEGGIWVRTEWTSGYSDSQTKTPPEWGDFPMSGDNWCPPTPPGPYSTKALGRNQSSPDPSDRVVGMGLPCNAHWSFELIFEEKIASSGVTPSPTPPLGPTNTPPTPGSNLLVNPGAETNNYTGWTTAGGMKIDPDVWIPSPGNHSGSHRFGHSVMGTLDAYMYQQVSVTPGELHEAGFFLSEMDGTDEYMEMRWINGGFGGTENLLYSTTGPQTYYPGWQEFSGAQFAPTSGTVTIILRFHHTAATGIAAWHVDDIYLWQVGGTPAATPTATPPGGPTPTIPSGSARWALSYGREYGEAMTAGVAGQAELFANWENGDYADIGMTNDANPGFAIFGYTGDGSNDPYTPGNTRVIFDTANDVYDFHVYDPAVSSDRSPDCYWLDGLPHYGHYRFEFWWRKVANDALYTFYPYDPVYHYDLVDGFNDPPDEPPGFSSDAKDLSSWAEYQAQTFVVPMNVNRIIGAKAWGDKGFAQKFRMVFSIRAGSPIGAQVGPSVTSREKDSNEFPNVNVSWGMEDVPVTPGGTYALRVEVLGGGGMNVHATTSSTYPSGMLYNGGTSVPGRDMIAVVVGAWRSGGGPGATPTPTSPVPTPTPTATEPPPVPTLTPTIGVTPIEPQTGLDGRWKFY